MNVLSLFDGISCGQIALTRANVEYSNYYASEIDTHAIQVTQHNFPNTKQLGNVLNINGKDLPKIDLLIGGSPCQSFSRAGKGEGFDGSSKLFWEFVRIMNETKPTYFLLENVKMKQEWRDIITKEMGVKPVLINSKLFSAQSRERLYWTNINFNELPEYNAEVLADVLCMNIINKREEKIITSKANFKVKVRKNFIEKLDLARYLKSYKNKSLREVAEYCNAPKTMVEHWFRLDSSFSIPQEEYWFKLKECLNITDTTYDKSVMEFEIKDNTFDMAKRVYHIDGKHPTLTTLTTGSRPTLTNGTDTFCITPEHCEKLQTLPIGYTDLASDRQRFKMIGNGWTVDVIAHILKGIINKN